MLQQLGSRGTGLAQGRHKLRDDPGIESVFLPNCPERYPYRLRRDARAGRDKGESSLPLRLPPLTMRGENPAGNLERSREKCFVKLWAEISPDDDGKSCLTIGYPSDF